MFEHFDSLGVFLSEIIVVFHNSCLSSATGQSLLDYQIRYCLVLRLEKNPTNNKDLFLLVI